ncbi:MAG: hypothetical protein QXD23_01115 [Candidatus Micrarchaeaceae archaeon]
MTIKTIISRSTPLFKKIQGTEIFISNEKADYNNYMMLLDRNNLKQLTYEKILKSINENQELKQNLKCKGFYIYYENNLENGFYTINNNGLLVPGRGNIEQTIFVWKKEINVLNNLSNVYSLIFRVESDKNATANKARFTIHDVCSPFTVAQIIVGERNNDNFETLKNLKK